MLIDKPLARFTRLFHRAHSMVPKVFRVLSVLRVCHVSKRPLLSVLSFLVFFVVLSAGAGFPKDAKAQDQAQDQSQEQVPSATQAMGQADLQHCPWVQAPSSRADALRFLSQSAAQRDQELTDLKTHEPQCLKESGYYARLGEYLLLTHKEREAIEALERALLLNAEQPGVQLDFAQALAQTGDVESANALLHQVLARSDVPKELRTVLEAVLQQGWTADGPWSAGVGSLTATPANDKSGAVSLVLNDPNSRADSRGSNALPGWSGMGVARGGGLAPGAVGVAGGGGGGAGAGSVTSAPPTDLKSTSKAWQDWSWSGSLQSMVGHDTNLNSASYTSTINLTLPNGIVPLALDASSLPQAGHTQVYAAVGLAQRALGDQTLSVGGAWTQRQTPNAPNLGLKNEELSLQLRPKNEVGWSQRAVLTHFELGGSPYFDGLSYTLWREWQAPGLQSLLSSGLSLKPLSAVASGADGGSKGGYQGVYQGGSQGSFVRGSSVSSGENRETPLNSSTTWVCHYMAGLEVNRRTYAQDSSQDGAYRGLMLGTLCGTPQHQFNVVFQSGTDWASDVSRAGGNQAREEMKLQWVRKAGRGRLGLEWGQQRLLDAQIYSELLGGVVRNTTRQNIRLSLDYEVTQKLDMIRGSLHWVSFWETLQYRSSVDLFNLKGQSIQTGLKWDL